MCPSDPQEEIAELCETYQCADSAVEAITVLAFQRSQDPRRAYDTVD